MSLRAAWELRNAAADTLIRIEEQLRQQLEQASSADIVELLEAFSPARSSGPEWSRSLDPLIERLWTWCDSETLAAVKVELEARGPVWSPTVNALAPERGAAIRAHLASPLAPSRLPPFTLV
jgi:hypothetical protein